MSNDSSSPASSPASASVFRIDKFVVPSQSISAFVERIHQVQRM